MSPKNPTAPADGGDEVAALLHTLLQTGRRLEELTGGQVDTVADSDGRTLLLRDTQEQLRHGRWPNKPQSSTLCLRISLY
jgi:hypothetical protein